VIAFPEGNSKSGSDKL